MVVNLDEENMLVTKEAVGKDYLKFYINSLDFFDRLTDKEIRVLLYISKFVGYCNFIALTPKFKKNMEIELNISQSTVSKALNGLKTKDVLYPINTPALQKVFENYTSDIYFTNMYFINPNLIGRDTSKVLNDFRYIFLKEFDSSKISKNT